MPEFLQKLLDQSSEIWNRLQPGQRVLIGSLSIAVIVTLVLAIFWVRQPDYVTLYSDLDQRDVGAILKTLRANNILSRVTNKGANIEVPATKRDEAFVLVSNANLPEGQAGLVGFELFDQRELGMTDKDFQVKYQRAIQDRLTRVILSFDGVRTALVTISPKKESLFKDAEEDAKAFVSITQKRTGDKSLGERQVKAIATLVEHGVPGLRRENVAVIVDGRDMSYLLSKDKEDPELLIVDASLKQLKIQQQYELYFTDKIQNALNQTFGPGNTQVLVNVDLDFTRKERESETFSPPVEGETEGMVRSEHEKRENYSGIPGGMPGGIPGVDSNVPGSPPQYPQAKGGVQPSEYDSRELTRNYEINRYTERFVGPNRGNYIRELSASVMVNSTKVLESPQLKTDIENTIRTVLASEDANTSPKVEVSFIQFAMPELLETEALGWERLAELALIALIVLSVVFLLRSMLIKREPQPKPAQIDAISSDELAKILARVGQSGPLDLDQFDAADGAVEAPAQPAPEEPMETPEEKEERLQQEREEEERLEEEQKRLEEERKRQEEDTRKQAMLEEVGRFMQENPQGAARLLAAWIIEDEEQ